MPNTKEPVPVSSEITPASWEEVVEAKKLRLSVELGTALPPSVRVVALALPATLSLYPAGSVVPMATLSVKVVLYMDVPASVQPPASAIVPEIVPETTRLPFMSNASVGLAVSYTHLTLPTN